MTGTALKAGNPLTDTVTLIARIAIGVIFIAHGWQKIQSGVAATGQGFASMGVPLPEIAGIVAIAIEFGGGIALVVGFALPVTGVLLAAQMVGAYVFGHFGTPLFVSEGGFELVLALGTAALALGFTGGGFALDRFLPWGRSTAAAPATARVA
ncbi:DoxX family protein [Nocardiopsis sediminis]|uniref:DoxX family protein n=1 Tax=Nocardiopsis sediminis TaxID=1778267 RepID=A0ABV8FIJ4_9ACTN